MAARTMRINSARGLLREFGIVFPAEAATLLGRVQGRIEDADAAVPILLRDLLHPLVLEIRELESRVKTVEKHLEALASQTPVVERLRTIPGVGARNRLARCRDFNFCHRGSFGGYISGGRSKSTCSTSVQGTYSGR